LILSYIFKTLMNNNSSNTFIHKILLDYPLLEYYYYSSHIYGYINKLIFINSILTIKKVFHTIIHTRK
jgi:hypothetical protein